MKPIAGLIYKATASGLRVRETATLTGKEIQILSLGETIGKATGNTFIAERYPDTGEPIEWAEFEADPYGYPPERYVASRYITTNQTVTPVNPVSTSTTDNTDLTSDPEISTDFNTPAPENNTSNYWIFGGLIVAVLALIALLTKK